MQFICEICGARYAAKPSAGRKYCSSTCYHRSEITKLPTADVLHLYKSGLSVEKIAAMFGVSGTAIKNNLRSSGCKFRPVGSHNQRGAKNPFWKGNMAGCSAMHDRVESALGKPRRCDVCGTTTAKRFDWANLTGRYADPLDYKRMCRSCHCKYDEAVKNFRHEPKSFNRSWASFEAIRKIGNECGGGK